MGRPRGYDADKVIERAGGLFWEQGFGATSIGQLEETTGLDRSSLYHAFGSKQALFAEAASRYVEANIDARLETMEADAGALDAVQQFFEDMSNGLRAEPEIASRGCMVVNAVAELPIGDAFAQRAGTSYRDRFRTAFAAALTRAAERGEVDAARTEGRALFLTATTMGLFVTARLDSSDAAAVARAVAVEIGAWRTGGVVPGSANKPVAGVIGRTPGPKPLG